MPALGLVLVPEEGVEPSRPCGHGILSPARLPVPPLRRRKVLLYTRRGQKTNRWNETSTSGRVGAMSPLDIGILALCGVLALFGLFQGFVRQVSSWVGLILGLVAGWKYGAEAQQLLHFDFPGGAIAAYLVTLVVVYIAV